MIEQIREMIKRLDEDILYHEEIGHAYTRNYRKLIARRKVLRRTLRKLERIEKRYIYDSL